MKRLLVVHHSHTDIGYTEPQGRIARWHVDFIRQALEISAAAPGFKWTCETFWSVERFLERAKVGEHEALANAVRAGRIGLSASYLNFNELIGESVLRNVVKRAASYGRSIGVPVDCAMTADINGYSWGFAQALVDAGVENLLSCVHTHHGMYPMGRTQTPFWWETPRGDRLFVLSGEHYHFGNELGIAPGAVSSYLTKDECDEDMIFHDHRAVAQIRIPRYLASLEDAGWPYDVVPVMVSGLRTDNGPPSARILEFIRWWNAEHGDVCRAEMATLSDLFRQLRATGGDLPTVRGDWPDWWSDGCAGSAAATRLFRQAQRDLDLHRHLRALEPAIPNDGVERVETDLALYAEHTFGHSDSMGSPWHLLVHAIGKRNEAHAAHAFDGARDLLDEAAEALGGGDLAVDMPLMYRVVNPLPHPVEDVARLPVGHHEFHELGLEDGIEVLDGDARLSHQLDVVPRGGEICAPLALPAGGMRILEVRPVDDDEPGFDDAAPAHLETPFVRIAWDAAGITSWRDRPGERELLRPDRRHAAFVPVHEITPCEIPGEVGAVRSAMGLDRKGPDAIRSAGTVTGARLLDDGDVFTRVELRVELPGTSYCATVLTAYHHATRVDVSVRFAKDTRWEPENVYLSLPFSTGSASPRTRLFKTGAIVEPRVDQIPGTLTDFSAVQEGFAITDGTYGVTVASLDGHLIQLGPLEPGPRRLAGDAALAEDPALPYAWLMTNYWETNFEASLGGFHEFRYSVLWGEDMADPVRARETAAAAGHGLFVVRRGVDRPRRADDGGGSTR